MSEEVEGKKDDTSKTREVEIENKDATSKADTTETAGLQEAATEPVDTDSTEDATDFKKFKKKSKKKESKEAKALEKKDMEIDALKEQLATLAKDNASLKDQMLRNQADLQNFRRRLVKDKEDAVKYANVSLIEDLLQPLDDFERALQASESTKDFTLIHDGVAMVNDKMLSILEKNWGLKKMECVGEEFDPSKHEAYMMEQDEKYKEETVIQELGSGYMLHDRVIRPAKVKVGKPL